MNKYYLNVTRTNFTFLLWILGLNTGIWITWSDGLMIIIHGFKKMTKEEYDENR